MVFNLRDLKYINVVLLAYFRGIKNLHFVRMVSSQLEY